MAGYNHYGIAISSDYGQTFTDIVTDFYPRNITCTADGQKVWLSAYDQGIFYSDNYGSTYTNIAASLGIPADKYYYGIAFDANGVNGVIMSDLGYAYTVSNGVAESIDLPGNFYEDFTGGLPGASISPDGTQGVFAYGGPGTYFHRNMTVGPPPPVPCFLEGSKILCQMNGSEQYVPIETIRPGTLVKTSLNGFVPVKHIGSRSMQNPGTAVRDKNALYLCTKEKYPELTEDLTLTGCHAILVDNITEAERQGIISTLERIFITDKKYRLPACVDQKAKEVETPGTYTVWHFALDHHHDKMNYGVYANGLLVETSSIAHMLTRNYNLVQ